MPSTIATGETITIPAGRTAILPDVQIDGTLNVQGKVFIPTGTTTSKVIPRVASTDNAIVRFDGVTGDVQNSAITIDDSGNIGSGAQSFNGFGGSGFKNYLYNPKFDVAQRGTVFQNNGTPGKQYTLDGWSTYFYDLNNTRFVNTTPGEISNKAIKFGRFDNKTDTYPSWLVQELEIKDSVPLRGKTVTVSFWAKKGSGLTSPIEVNIRTGTAGDESWTAEFTGNVDNIFYPNLTTTLTKYSYTVTLNSNIKQVSVVFCLPGFSATGVVNDWVWIEQVQLEEGSVATPFENRPYGLELSLCQRYYQIFSWSDRKTATANGQYLHVSATLPIQMRVLPTIVNISQGNKNNATYIGAGALSERHIRCEAISPLAGDSYVLNAVEQLSAEL